MLAAPHAVIPQAGRMSMLAFPVARTPVPEIVPLQAIPGPLLPCTVTSWSDRGPLGGAVLVTRIPPKVLLPDAPGPLFVTVVFRMSKAAPSSRMPPPFESDDWPTLPVTSTWFSCTVEPVSACRPIESNVDSFTSRAYVVPPETCSAGLTVPAIVPLLWPTSDTVLAKGLAAPLTVPRTTTRAREAVTAAVAGCIEQNGVMALPPGLALSEQLLLFCT